MMALVIFSSVALISAKIDRTKRVKFAPNFDETAGFVVGAYEFPELFLSRSGQDTGFGVHFEKGSFLLPSDDESDASSAADNGADEPNGDAEEKGDSEEPEEILNGDQVVGLESTDSNEKTATRIAYQSFDEFLALENPLASLKGITRKIAFPVLKQGDKPHRQAMGFVEVRWVPLLSAELQIQPTGARQAEIASLREEQKRKEIQKAIEERTRRLKSMQRSDDQYNYFEITLTKKKKLELLFEPGKAPLKLTKRVKYLRAGDEMVGINGVDITKFSINRAFQTLRDAAFPKRVRWRRFIDKSNDLGIQLGSIQILSPPAAAGCFTYRIAKFGGIPMCDTMPVRDAGNGCRALGEGFNGTLALAFRDTICNFQTKVNHISQAKGRAVAIVNTAEALMQMMSKKNRRDSKNSKAENKVQLPVVQISKTNGHTLRHIINMAALSKTAVPARMGDPLICGYKDPCKTVDPLEIEVVLDKKQERARQKALRSVDKFMIPTRLLNRRAPPLKRRPRKKVKLDSNYKFAKGTMFAWNGLVNMEFEYSVATFGWEAETTPSVMMWASDKNNRISKLCHSGAMLKIAAIRKNGCVWLVGQRGDCPYTQKAKVVQAVGGCGMIIINKDDKVPRMVYDTNDKSSIKGIKMTSVMIGKTSGAALERAMDPMSKKAFGVFRLLPGTVTPKARGEDGKKGKGESAFARKRRLKMERRRKRRNRKK